MLRLEEVSKRFGELLAVDGVTLDVPRGELLALLGPSGCGKTTTLRMIAGFEPVSAGRIILDGRDVTALRPQQRGAGMVFQSYALFPHLDVYENVAFGLKARGAPREEIPRRVERALELVDLRGYRARRVQQLSGGQQQRVALARALAPEPPILLLDEPLSNLDAALRERTRDELRAVLRRVGITSVFVTHDQEEAFALSDRIALMNQGRVQQVGTPESLYMQPATPFAAAFVGRASFLDAVVRETGPEALVCEVAPGLRWRARVAASRQPAVGAAVRLLARPEQLEFRRAEEPGGGAGAGQADGPAAGFRDPRAGEDGPDALPGRVLGRRFGGATTYYRIGCSLPAPGGGAAPRPIELLVQGPADAAGHDQPVHVRPKALLLAYPVE